LLYRPSHPPHASTLGTLDANSGDELIGWDTDQFPTSLYLTLVLTPGAAERLSASYCPMHAGIAG
jgi:hypothetical protein